MKIFDYKWSRYGRNTATIHEHDEVVEGIWCAFSQTKAEDNQYRSLNDRGQTTIISTCQVRNFDFRRRVYARKTDEKGKKAGAADVSMTTLAMTSAFGPQRRHLDVNDEREKKRVKNYVLVWPNKVKKFLRRHEAKNKILIKRLKKGNLGALW